MTWPLVLVALVGMGIGIWLGMPGRYTQTADELENRMKSGGSTRRLKKRNINPLAWMQRSTSAKAGPSRSRRRERGARSGFSLESPEDRER